MLRHHPARRFASPAPAMTPRSERTSVFRHSSRTTLVEPSLAASNDETDMSGTAAGAQVIDVNMDEGLLDAPAAMRTSARTMPF
mgnify:CR=1 FL=1